MYVVITGGNGQDAALLANLLKQQGIRSGLLSRGKSDEFKLKAKYLQIENFDWYQTDYSFKSLVEILRGCSATHVVNLASQSSVWRSINEPIATASANINVFLNLLQASDLTKTVHTFMTFSSSEVLKRDWRNSYNHNEVIDTPYSLSKSFISDFIKISGNQFDIEIIDVLLFSHESEFRSSKYFWGKFFSAIFDTKNFSVKPTFGNVNILRDYSLAADTMNIVLKILTGDIKDSAVAIGSGYQINVFEAMKHVTNLLGVDINEKFDFRVSECPESYPELNDAVRRGYKTTNTEIKGLEVFEKLIESYQRWLK